MTTLHTIRNKANAYIKANGIQNAKVRLVGNTFHCDNAVFFGSLSGLLEVATGQKFKSLTIGMAEYIPTAPTLHEVIGTSLALGQREPKNELERMALDCRLFVCANTDCQTTQDGLLVAWEASWLKYAKAI